MVCYSKTALATSSSKSSDKSVFQNDFLEITSIWNPSMASDHSQERVLTVLIYEASYPLTPHLCYNLLKEACPNMYSIRFHLLETDDRKFKVAESHCDTVNLFGFKLLDKVIVTKDPREAFENIDYAIIFPSIFFEQDVEYSKLYDGKIFIYVGQGLENYAKKSVKVIIFGQKSVNAFCSVCSYFCPSIDPSQITGVSCHYEFKARQVLADKIEGVPRRIRHAFVWGTDHVDVMNACYQDIHDTETNIEGNTSAVHVIVVDDNGTSALDICNKYLQESMNPISNYENLQSSVTENHTSGTQLNSSDSWIQSCGLGSGFHCKDITLVENNFDCYSCNLWDVNCPEVTYRTKYFERFVTNKSDDAKTGGNTGSDPNPRKELAPNCIDTPKSCKFLPELIEDDVWIKSNLIDSVKELDSSLATKATLVHAITRHFHHLVCQSKEPLSMIVKSDGAYNVDECVYFSFPVIVVDEKVVIVKDVCINSATQRYIQSKSIALKRFVDYLPAMVENFRNKKSLQKEMMSLILDTLGEKVSSTDMDTSIYSYTSGPNILK